MSIRSIPAAFVQSKLKILNLQRVLKEPPVNNFYDKALSNTENISPPLRVEERVPGGRERRCLEAFHWISQGIGTTQAKAFTLTSPGFRFHVKPVMRAGFRDRIRLKPVVPTSPVNRSRVKPLVPSRQDDRFGPKPVIPAGFDVPSRAKSPVPAQ